MTAYPRSASPRADHVEAVNPDAMVSTSHPLATAAALDMLRRGGSAADAYIAAAAVQAVVEPPMTTFGGGLGMCWFDGILGTTTLVMGRFGRPAGEDGNWDEAGADGGRTVAMPGWLNGANAAWRRFGRLRWPELFEHALAHAREGFVIDPHLWGWIWEYRYKMARFPDGQRLWYPQGYLLNVGDRLRQPDLARTIEHIQRDEELSWFYCGDFAQRYVAIAREDGGRITLEDMVAHRGTALVAPAPVVGHYRGYDIHAPGSMLVALALQAVEHGGLRDLGPAAANPETLYRQMRLIEEIWHEGLAIGAVGMGELFSRAAAAPTAEKVAALWERVLKAPSRPFDPLHPGTNAIVIADKEGNVAHGTHSCSCAPFGNGHIVDGVWLSRPVLVYGQPAPLPVGLTTSLLLARNGKAALAVGSPSVSCLHNILQNTMNVVEFGLTPGESVRQPMFGAPWFPSQRAMIEGNFSEPHYVHLTQRGMGFKRVSPNDCEMGSCHMVVIGKSGISGVADPRRRGQAAGPRSEQTNRQAGITK